MLCVSVTHLEKEAVQSLREGSVQLPLFRQQNRYFLDFGPLDPRFRSFECVPTRGPNMPNRTDAHTWYMPYG